MKKRNKLHIAAIACVVISAVVVFTAAQHPDFKVGRNMEILMNIFREINYFYVDEVDPDKILQDGADGMTSSLDPYTEFISEDEMADFEILTTGKYGGIGSLIRQKGEWIYIAEPYKASPADKSGLKIGDKILEIDGKSARGIGQEKVSSSLKGDPGTTVKVKFEDFFTGEEKEVDIKRERIVISGIPYYGFIEDGIGYIQHSDFTEDCSSDMRKAVMELKKGGNLRGLVLDYRSNGGGILQEAVKILSLFLPKGTEVVSMKGRSQETTAVFKTESDPIDLSTPIVVLTNSGSASAAEIVAGALQDLDRAVLVGQRTFGKGLVQSPKPVGYNGFLKITTAKYYMPSGRCIQAVDYAHKNEDGSVSTVPDSLINEFRTANGRLVYDGGGIMPDVKLDPEYVSRFTIILYGKRYIDDFADLYSLKYRDPVDPVTFRLSDEDYRWFNEFMADKDIEYQSETATALKTLREKAERERYMDNIQGDLDQIEKKLQDDKSSNLELYKDQLSKLIEDNIVLRYNYREGIIEHNLHTDTEIKEAKNLLLDSERYQTIITSQDTSRK